ncbi:hypothetical protein [Planomonospora venezuelensis]|uniref:Uncharacterized protein n=1 Tax=Planomonospora venezuelensis TaxID=1999 RepID=A0A841DDN5_PLAVE|nr:hypothetical protein [Planomonospora venezuelensis]MBB5965416.1 hypothetical protein [Planomonospora venezuelensis]GIM62513.1 hypothetical protein Pve01_76870 [Planomonospora venezuelensis]
MDEPPRRKRPPHAPPSRVRPLREPPGEPSPGEPRPGGPRPGEPPPAWPPQGSPHRAPPGEPGWSAALPGRARPYEASGDDDLPPSARWYGTPATPPRRRVPRRLRRLLLGALALAACAAVAVAAGVLALRTLPSADPPARVSDPAAGVGYPLPAGWRQGAVPPVTGFTSAAGDGAAVTVLVGPGEPAADPREAAVGLADLYGRLLLHGDEVEVDDDRPVAAGGWTGHSRTLRAEYRDVVNGPAYLRVVFLTGPGGPPVVVVAVAKPDGPGVRAGIEAVVAGIRRA